MQQGQISPLRVAPVEMTILYIGRGALDKMVAIITGILMTFFGAAFSLFYWFAVSTDFEDEITAYSYIFNPGFLFIFLGLGLVLIGNNFLKEKKNDYN